MSTQRHTGRQNYRGFTLIELMIVVAVVAILSAIAIPAYNQYVTRSKLTEAFSNLSSLSVAMQQYYQDNRSYADMTSASTPDPWPCATANRPTGKYFNFTCTVSTTTPTLFTLTATATSSDLTAGGAMTYTIDQDGTKATAIVPSGWSKPSPNTCWARDKAGDC